MCKAEGVQVVSLIFMRKDFKLFYRLEWKVLNRVPILKVRHLLRLHNKSGPILPTYARRLALE